MGLSEGGGIGRQVKTFSKVVTPGQIPGYVARLEDVTSLCSVQKDSLVNKNKE